MDTMVSQQRPTAVIGRRVGAFLIDFLLTGVIYWGLFFLFAERRATEPTDAVRANFTLGDTTYAITGGKALLFFLVFVVLGFLYWSVLPGITGWTLGKLAVGIRVAGESGNVPAGVGRNLLRQIVGIVDYFPYFLPGLVGFIIALVDDRNRRLGDMAAKTYVIRRDAAGQPLPAAAPGSPVASAGAPAAAAGGPDAAAGAPAASGSRGPASTGPQAGWYADPTGQARLRYWDGQTWTEHTAA